MVKWALMVVSLMGLLSACSPVYTAISGGAAAVNHANEERTTGRAFDDLTIETKIGHLYFNKELNDLFANVDADVVEGRVLLTGSVNNVETAIDAVNLAWQVRGVREVINELQVKGTTPPEVDAQDLWIRTKINGRFIFAKDVNYANYTIEVVNGKVYLMGIAESQEEIQRAATIASQVDGVVKVISHVITRDDPRRG